MVSILDKTVNMAGENKKSLFQRDLILDIAVFNFLNFSNPYQPHCLVNSSSFAHYVKRKGFMLNSLEGARFDYNV